MTDSTPLLSVYSKIPTHYYERFSQQKRAHPITASRRFVRVADRSTQVLRLLETSAETPFGLREFSQAVYTQGEQASNFPFVSQA